MKFGVRVSVVMTALLLSGCSMNVKLPVDSLGGATPTTPRSTETALSPDAVQISITQSNRSFAQRGSWDLLSYPVFTEVSGGVGAIVNTLNAHVESRLKTLEKEKAVELDISAEPHYISQHLVVFVLHEYNYVRGAAHGETLIESFAFDATNGERIDLWGQVKPERIGAFQQLVFEEAVAQRGDVLFGEDDVKSALQSRDVFRAFRPESSGIVVTFNQYDVAPYAAGPQEVLLTWESLKTLLDDKSVVGQVFSSKLK